VKHTAVDDVPGAKSVYEVLKARFLHVKRNHDGEIITGFRRGVFLSDTPYFSLGAWNLVN
jgi:hypothetical protein